MWIISRIFLAWTALAAGFAAAGGFVAFVSLMGVIPRLSAMTKTASHIPLYENCLAHGLIAMNLISLYPLDFSFLPRILSTLFLNCGGFFTGIFVGCLAGALAEVVNIIPVMARRLKVRKGFPWFVKAFALGKCIGTLLQFFVFPK